ncbi:MAG: hypothetical protein HYY50_04875 [Candidatus Kerfeldbacteria bacterium]|nr:hypothetical protein [Candidatus Kerfeldbacteria bacterium]
MTSALTIYLVIHVLAGLAGTAGFYGAWFNLLRGAKNFRALRAESMTGLIMILVSWVTGAVYYVTYYGATVKPLIKAGPYPWAHAFLMEWKEHVFLFLPFLAAVVTIAIWRVSPGDQLPDGTRRWLGWLCGLIVFLGAAMALAGTGISGAVR